MNLRSFASVVVFVLLAPVLSGCVWVAAGGAVAGVSAARQERSFGNAIDEFVDTFYLDHPDKARQQRRPIGQPDHDACRQHHPEPGDNGEQAIRITDVKQARAQSEWHRLKKARRRQQAARTQQRAELVERDQERDQVNGRESALEDEPAQPVGGLQPAIDNRGQSQAQYKDGPPLAAV